MKCYSISSLLYSQRTRTRTRKGRREGVYLRINSALYSIHYYYVAHGTVTQSIQDGTVHSRVAKHNTMSCFDLLDLENRDHSYTIMQGIVNTKVKHKCVQMYNTHPYSVFTQTVQLYRHAQSLLITSRHYRSLRRF